MRTCAECGERLYLTHLPPGESNADEHDPREAPGEPEWLEPLREAVAQVGYKDWRFDVGVEGNGAPFLQIVFEDAAQDPTTQYCRKWLLYETMNPSEAVRTAWLAVLAAEEHEARERFTYRGRHVMGPHFDVDKLADFTRYRSNLAFTRDPVPSE